MIKKTSELASVVTTLVTQESTSVEKSSASPSSMPTEIDKEKPSAIELLGPAHRVLAEASVLIRLGFMFSTEQPIEMFAATGHALVRLVPGDPGCDVVNAASEAFEHALAVEQHSKLDAEQRTAAIEKERAKEAAKAATRLALTTQIAEQQESLRQLQATLAAA